MTRRRLVAGPVGSLLLESDGAALTAVRFTPTGPRDDASLDEGGVLAAAAAQLAEYFLGERTRFELPLSAAGTAFQRDVWAALLEIPYAATWSYRDVARRIGRPDATRAVGAACGRNPLAVVVPCHRVVGANGSLTGYEGGVPIKRALLALEARRGGANDLDLDLDPGTAAVAVA